jgi:hypothetical protein
MRRRLAHALLRVAPAVRCERCGEELFRALPVLSGGRLRLYGAERALVRVAFSSRRTLVFRHEAIDACRRDVELPVSELGDRP